MVLNFINGINLKLLQEAPYNVVRLLSFQSQLPGICGNIKDEPLHLALKNGFHILQHHIVNIQKSDNGASIYTK